MFDRSRTETPANWQDAVMSRYTFNRNIFFCHDEDLCFSCPFLFLSSFFSPSFFLLSSKTMCQYTSGLKLVSFIWEFPVTTIFHVKEKTEQKKKRERRENGWIRFQDGRKFNLGKTNKNEYLEWVSQWRKPFHKIKCRRKMLRECRRFRRNG